MPVAPRGMPSESVFFRPSPESDAVAFAPSASVETSPIAMPACAQVCKELDASVAAFSALASTAAKASESTSALKV